MKRIITLFLLVLLLGSCKKYLELKIPSTQLTGEAIFRSDVTATAAMLAIYTQMESSGFIYNLFVITGTSADELRNHRSATDAIAAHSNSLTPENSYVNSFWTNLYKYIYQCNAILSGVERSTALSGEVANQLRGEALFLRAWCHFYLAALFENVPYVTGIDPEQNTILQQQQSKDIYLFLVADLQEAISLLSPDYVTAANRPGGERVRPNRYAAAALLSRVHLYLGNWTEAGEQASSVLNNIAQYGLVTNLQEVFLKNSKEAIWQLQPVLSRFNSYAGANLNGTNTIPNITSLSLNLVDSFEANDLRRMDWTRQTTAGSVVYTWPHKFKVGQNAPAITEHTVVLRLAEVILTRAEAYAMQNKLPEAMADLNAIRQRAGLPPVSSVTKGEIIQAIHKERRMELFAEYGDRWIDLRRTGKIDEVMIPVKGAEWNSADALYPIPLNEMLRHPGMQQNAGY